MHVRSSQLRFLTCLAPFALALLTPMAALADGDLRKVNHIIIVMQENHSFDNYFGVLAYAPGTPYHPGASACQAGDHACVDGLSCQVDSAGNLSCLNSNIDDDGTRVRAFHDPSRCVSPDLDHGWFSTHQEANFNDPNATLGGTVSDGFVRVNDTTEQVDQGVETATDDQTMGFYNQDDIPFYYDLAQKFALDDRYFSSVLGPTFPNRSYFMAATSFGHVTTNDEVPPLGGYKPITGTIFDLLDRKQVSWGNYFQDVPQGASFRELSVTTLAPHFFPVSLFLAQAAGVPGVGALPQVSLVDPNFGALGTALENDEHPPTDIQRGQAFVAQLVNTVRQGPYWKDSVIFITYDDHGGFYDHVAPPRAPQGPGRTPDGISPGQCADLSNPPSSMRPGGGAECSVNTMSTTDTSVLDAQLLCPQLAVNPTGPYPAQCASFDQLGFRVPFLVVSPFAKPHYVSHTVGDHTSLLAFIEKRFLSGANGRRLYLTMRDQHASTLEDLFDFDNAPSLGTAVLQAQSPADDCTPLH